MHAFTRPLTLLLASCALLTGACDPDFDRDSADAAVVAHDEAVTPASLGLGDGWLPLQEGLWTRADAAGEQEYAAIGEAGTPHAIAKLEEVEAELELALEIEPSDENREHLDELRARITDLSVSPLVVDSDEVSLRCHVSNTGTAVAKPIACGVSATATAGYDNTCTPGAKSLSTYALAKCNGETKTHSCGRTGNPINCFSSVSITGSAPCYSYASFQIPGITVWKDNSTRGACNDGTTTSNNTTNNTTSNTSVGTSIGTSVGTSPN